MRLYLLKVSGVLPTWEVLTRLRLRQIHMLFTAFSEQTLTVRTSKCFHDSVDILEPYYQLRGPWFFNTAERCRPPETVSDKMGASWCRSSACLCSISRGTTSSIRCAARSAWQLLSTATPACRHGEPRARLPRGQVWAFVLPVTLLRLPYSLLEAVVWSIIVYWSVGFAPDAGRVRHKSGVLLLEAVLAGRGICLRQDVCLAAYGHSLVTSCPHS